MLKNKAFLVFLCLIALSMTVCGCVSKGNYDTLKKDYEISQANMASAQREYEFLQSQMDDLQEEYDDAKADLEAEIANQSASLTTANNNIATLTKNMADLQSKLDATLDTKFKFTYSFRYNTWNIVWDISIPLREYLYYQDKPRIADNSKYTTMVNDNHADSLLNILVSKIKDATLYYDLKKTDTVDMVAAFVQSLIYSSQDTSTPYNDRPLYPIETIFEQGGDCEDTSILAAALLQRLEYNQVVFIFSQPKHVALGIDIAASQYVTGWEYQSKRYIFLETSGDNFTLGAAPAVYTTLQPTIVPIGQ